MQTLADKPSLRTIIILILIGLIATLVIRALFAPLEATMQASGGGGYGIVAYELAFTPEKAETILAAWDAGAEAAAARSLWIDFAFMPAYALLFAGITLLVARAQSGTLLQIGLWVCILPVVAALLDGIENIMLLIVLGQAGQVMVLPPPVAGVAASIKFFLLLVTLLYWPIGGIGSLWRLIKRRSG